MHLALQEVSNRRDFLSSLGELFQALVLQYLCQPTLQFAAISTFSNDVDNHNGTSAVSDL